MRLNKYIMLLFLLLYTYAFGDVLFEKIKISNIENFIDYVITVDDINSDYLPDIFISGKLNKKSGCDYAAEIFINTGNSYNLLTDNLIPVTNGKALFVDIDNDGTKDLIYTGKDKDNNSIVVIYKNNGSDFILYDMNILNGFSYSSIESIDFNKDGLVDFILSGLNNNGVYESSIIVNKGNAILKQEKTKLPDLIQPNINKIDYNLDGFDDIVISGKNISDNNVINVYQNDKGEFKLNSRINFPDFSVISMKIFDIDNDGDDDIIVSGYDSTNSPITGIFYNKPTGYINQNINKIIGIVGDIAVSDFNLDGYADIVVAGFNEDFRPVCNILYRGESGQFDIQNLDISLYNTKIFTGYFSNDKKPDIFIYGLDSLNNTTAILLSNGFDHENAPPSLPEIIKASKIAYNYIVFENSFATDDNSDTLSLKYQYRLGPIENPDYFLSSENNFLSSALLVQTFYMTLLPGKYVYQLRVIDNTGISSEWSPVDTIEVNEFTNSGINFRGLYCGKIGTTDFNNDGLIDIYYNGFNSHNEPMFYLYINQGKTYNDGPDIALKGSGFGNSYMGDINNDGTEDLVITGAYVFDRLSEKGHTKVFYNENDSLIEKSIQVMYGDSTVYHLPNLMESYVKIADINNDMKKDIILMGTKKLGANNYEPKFFIFTCDGDDKFIDWGNVNIDGFRYGSFDIGDLNNDGLPDIVLVGLSWNLSNQLIAKASIYIQKKDNKFEELRTADLYGVELASNVKLFDINNDNRLDIIIQGGESVSNAKIIGYLNNFPDFTECFNIDGAFVGDLDIMDIDHDNSIEIISTGWSPSLNNPSSVIYTYDGNSLKKMDNIILDNLYWSSAKFIDFDNDNHNDILISGINANNIPVTVLYRNSIFPDTFEVLEPDLPTNFKAVSIKDTVVLSWNSDPNYFYNIKIYDSSDSCIFENSYILANDKIVIKKLFDGEYIARIYSYDKGFKKSKNYKEIKFNIDTSPPEITDCVMKSIVGIGDVRCNIRVFDPSGLDTTHVPYIFLAGKDTIVFSIESFYSNLIIAKANITYSNSSGNYKLYIKGIKDKKNNQLDDILEIKEVYIDTEQPMLINSFPNDGEQFVSTYTTLKFYLSKIIDEESVNINNCYLTDAQKNKISGQYYVSYISDTTICLFQPEDRLNNNKLYTLYLGTNIKDTLGNPLDKEYLITFKTADLVKPDIGATIFSPDSVVSLYIPPFSIDKEEEFSFLNVEKLLGEEDYIIRLFPNVKFVSPVSLFLNLNKIDNIDLSEEKTFAVFDSVSSGYIPLQAIKDEKYVNIPINQTGIYALLKEKNMDNMEIVVDKIINISPRVFFPDKENLNISFSIDDNSKVTIKIFDISGRLNAIVLDAKEYSDGNYTILWNGKSNDGDKLKGGLYILLVKIDNKVYKKTFVIKY